MTKDEALKLALEWLDTDDSQKIKMAKHFIEQALAQTEQEPVAHWSDCAVHSEPAYPKGGCDCGGYTPPKPSPATDEGMKIYKAIADNYTTPPQRKPLTDEEIEDLYFDKFSMGELKAFARAIEAAHGIKEKNT